MKRFLAATITALFILISSSALAADRTRGVELGKAAPDFTFPDRYGSLVSLHDYVGKKVVLFFWVSWCTCRDQLKPLQKFRDDNKGKNFEIVSVSIDGQGLRYVTPIVESADVKYPVLLDTLAKSAQKFHFPATPAVFLIDEAGAVKQQYLVEFDIQKPDTRNELEAFLAEKAVAAPKLDTPSPDELLASLKKQSEEKPDDIELRRRLAGLLSDRSDYAAALPQWDFIVKSKKKTCPDQFSLGSTYYRLDDKDNAIKYWKAASRCDPTNYIYMRTAQSFEKPEMFYTKDKMKDLYSDKLNAK